MYTGTVKWFNNAKGYGFIVADPHTGLDCGDIFAHFSAIEMDGYKTLKAGQLVSFSTTPGPKGLHAVNIRSHRELDCSGSGLALERGAPLTSAA